MGFLKNILGAFVEFKEENKSSQPKQSNKGQADEVHSTTTEKPQPTTHFTGSSSPEYQKHFNDLIEEANAKNPLFQGTDFKEFIDSKSDVEGIADEPTRYRTAFNVLKRAGLTKEKLVTTGRAYINVIDKDINAFEAVYNEQYKIQVQQKEQLLQHKAQELQALTEKIESLNKEMKQLSQELSSSKERLGANKNSFVLSGENIKQEIETELKKIDEYFS